MDRLFDRLNSLIRSLLLEDEITGGTRTGDRDLDEAMDELDDFLRTGKERQRPQPPPGSGARSQAGPRPKPSMSEEIRRDYSTLECAPGASMEEVRRAYRRLLRAYHPDKHADDAEKQRIATEITQKLTGSYLRIRRHLEGSRATSP